MRELTGEDLNYLALFEKVTRVFPQDYFLAGDALAFLVEKDKLGSAIGKNGSHIHRLQSLLRKRVFVVADTPDASDMARNFFSNVRIVDVKITGSTLTVYVDEQDRGFAIGKNGERIKLAKELFRKKFDLHVEIRTRRSLSPES